MKRNKKWLQYKQCCLAGIMAFASCSALADKTPDISFTPTQKEWVSLQVTGGYLTGRSRELVYEEDKKVSELLWDINGAAIVGGSATFHPHLFSDLFSLRLKGWVPVASKNTMNDYDWLSDSSHWSDWSHHTDVPMRGRNYQIDGSLILNVLKKDNASLGVIGGFQHTTLGWTSFGGTYNYENGKKIGTFPDQEQGISYAQYFNIPYLGIEGSTRWDRFELSGEVKGSLWGRASDRDIHHMRDLVFRESFQHVPMLGAAAQLSYYLTNAVSLDARLEGQKYFHQKGDTTISRIGSSDILQTEKNGAGIEHTSGSASLGVTVRL